MQVLRMGKKPRGHLSNESGVKSKNLFNSSSCKSDIYETSPNLQKEKIIFLDTPSISSPLCPILGIIT